MIKVKFLMAFEQDNEPDGAYIYIQEGEVLEARYNASGEIEVEYGNWYVWIPNEYIEVIENAN